MVNPTIANGKMAAVINHCQDMRSRSVLPGAVARYDTSVLLQPAAHSEAAGVAVWVV